jgi:hypothetical protein
VLASDKYSKINESILVLELYLRKDDGKNLDRVVIELNRVEAKAFVGRLREIERVRLIYLRENRN